MAGGTQSLDSTPKIHESSPIEEVPQPVLNPTPRKRARMGGGRADGVPFSGLCMYFEDEELDEIDYPNSEYPRIIMSSGTDTLDYLGAHRQVKQEIQEDDDMLGALDIAEDTSDDANFGADLAAEVSESAILGCRNLLVWFARTEARPRNSLADEIAVTFGFPLVAMSVVRSRST